MSFTNDDNVVEEEVRYDPEYGPYPFFKSMEDAEKKGMVGTEFCIGEMPLGPDADHNSQTVLWGGMIKADLRFLQTFQSKYVATEISHLS